SDVPGQRRLIDERNRHRVGADAVACGAAGGMGGAQPRERLTTSGVAGMRLPLESGHEAPVFGGRIRRSALSRSCRALSIGVVSVSTSRAVVDSMTSERAIGSEHFVHVTCM